MHIVDGMVFIKAVPTDSFFGFSLYLKFDVFKKDISQCILVIAFSDVQSLPCEFPRSKRSCLWGIL